MKRRKLRKSIKHTLIALIILILTPHILAKCINAIAINHHKIAERGFYVEKYNSK